MRQTSAQSARPTFRRACRPPCSASLAWMAWAARQQEAPPSSPELSSAAPPGLASASTPPLAPSTPPQAPSTPPQAPAFPEARPLLSDLTCLDVACASPARSAQIALFLPLFPASPSSPPPPFGFRLFACPFRVLPSPCDAPRASRRLRAPPPFQTRAIAAARQATFSYSVAPTFRASTPPRSPSGPPRVACAIPAFSRSARGRPAGQGLIRQVKD
mmetsp:Transcript_56517/g.155378  ORF Transcript_56517/g.155378 Transcript_56517/m.155378 type:complete len:216 (+) Transcript_56517:588-1235(+)